MVNNTLMANFDQLIGILDAYLKIFKIPYYGFTMLSLDLTLSHTCISYGSAKFLGKNLLGQCIFFISKVL